MEVVLSKLFPNEIVDHLMEYITYNNIPIWRNKHKKKYFIQLSNNLQNFMRKVSGKVEKIGHFYNFNIHNPSDTNTLCSRLTRLSIHDTQRYIDQNFIKLVRYCQSSMFLWYGVNRLPGVQLEHDQGQLFLELSIPYMFLTAFMESIHTSWLPPEPLLEN
jgi:hypothetical protein